MTFRLPFMCPACTRFNHNRGTCDAFPYGIPRAILDGAPHWEPWPGDHDLQFEAKPEGGPILQTYLLYWYNVEGVD